MVIYYTGDGNAYINSTDNSVRNININQNVAEIFDKMLKVASDLPESDRSIVVESINEMSKHCGKPSMKERYYKFIEVAANHISVFAPLYLY